MRLINKLKRLVGIDIVEYNILYTNPLSPSQRMQLANKMISKFGGSCRPNRIIVSQQTVSVDMQSACLTGPQLKKISDDTLAPEKVEISYIKINNDVIWSKN
jgi:hypothetical protein